MMQKSRDTVKMKFTELAPYRAEIALPTGDVVEIGFVRQGEVAAVRSALDTLHRHGCIAAFGLTRTAG